MMRIGEEFGSVTVTKVTLSTGDTLRLRETQSGDVGFSLGRGETVMSLVDLSKVTDAVFMFMRSVGFPSITGGDVRSYQCTKDQEP